MASEGAEFEDQIQDWMKQYKTLPPDRKKQVDMWFATQKIIIENSGLSVQEWFGYIQWAMDNPFDYSFVQDFPDNPDEKPDQDAAEVGDATKSARELVGGEAVKTPLADGPGIQEKAKSKKELDKEMFDQFMRNRRG